MAVPVHVDQRPHLTIVREAEQLRPTHTGAVTEANRGRAERLHEQHALDARELADRPNRTRLGERDGQVVALDVLELQLHEAIHCVPWRKACDHEAAGEADPDDRGRGAPRPPLERAKYHARGRRDATGESKPLEQQRAILRGTVRSQRISWRNANRTKHCAEGSCERGPAAQCNGAAGDEPVRLVLERRKPEDLRVQSRVPCAKPRAA